MDPCVGCLCQIELKSFPMGTGQIYIGSEEGKAKGTDQTEMRNGSCQQSQSWIYRSGLGRVRGRKNMAFLGGLLEGARFLKSSFLAGGPPP